MGRAAHILLSLMLVGALTLATFDASNEAASFQAVLVGTPVSLGEVVVETPSYVPAPTDDDILWLARCIYSETKRPEEQELVAWVVRNRVDSGYRGQTTYRGVVLDPMQFSAFNPGGPDRRYLLRLDRRSWAPGWRETIEIADRVARALPHERPFSITTRHFYSERSMRGWRRHPDWSRGEEPVGLALDIDPRRFRFFDDVE